MCGIVGYIGKRQGWKICYEGLQTLQYRGYDSAGIAAIHDGKLRVVKQVGKLEEGLGELLQRKPPAGTIALGHTRWATHGRPSTINSHPHTSTDGKIAVVHNGIIENYAELRDELIAEGYKFKSQTDTEVIAHLVQKYYEDDLFAAVVRALADMEGAYAIGVLHQDEPGKMVAGRQRSPLVIGLGKNENYVASDMAAIRKETDQVYLIDDGEAAVVTADEITLYRVASPDGKPLKRPRRITKEPYRIPWPAAAVDKAGYEKYMHKEIHYQPAAMRQCLKGRIDRQADKVVLDTLGMTKDEIRNIDKVVLTACGTAYHSGMVGKFLLEGLARIPSECALAAELLVQEPLATKNTLGIVISQSGETMDTLLALRALKEKGAKVICVVNRPGSIIERESDGCVPIEAGPELGVASTKAYTLQILTLTMIALHFAAVRRTAPPKLLKELRKGLLACPRQAKALLRREPDIIKISKKYVDCPNALYLGRGVNLPSAMEGALKNKEISYMHAEGYSAGEMKHGPIALVEPDLLTVAIAVQGTTYDKMIGNMQEIRARGGPLVGVVNDGDEAILEHLDDPIFVPPCPELVSPITVAIPLQLLAYHIAHLRGEDIDQPRNLAKTVTVE